MPTEHDKGEGMEDPLKDYEHFNVRDWNGYDDEPITPAVLERARLLLDLLRQKPWPAPGGDGSIGIEWHTEAGYLLVDVGPGDSLTFLLCRKTPDGKEKIVSGSTPPTTKDNP